MEEINYRGFSKDKLIRLSCSKDLIVSEGAKEELNRRNERKKFLISFLFPNIWAVLAFFIALYNVFHGQ